MSIFDLERIPGEVFEGWAKSRPFQLYEITKDKIRAEFLNAYVDAIPLISRDGHVEFTDRRGARWSGNRVHGEFEITTRVGDRTENSAFDMRHHGDYFVHREGKLIRKVTKVEGRKQVGVLPITLERQFNDSTAAGKIMDHIKRFGQAFIERDASRPVTLTRFEHPTGWVRW